MSDEIKSGGEGADASGTASDPIQNLKAEYERKLGNFESTLNQLKQSNDQLANQLRAKAEPAVPAKKLGDLLYENPDAAVDAIVSKVTTAISQSTASQNKVTQAMSEIINEFPEARDQNSALFQRAARIYQSYAPEEQTPKAMKLAAKEAAEELGVLPVSKRQKGNDDFVGGNSGGNRPSQRGGKEGDIDDTTLAFAEAIDLEGHLKRMGIKTDAADVKKRLSKRSERKTWNRYR